MTRSAREMGLSSAERVTATLVGLAVVMMSVGPGCSKSAGTATDAAVMDAAADALPSVYGKRTSPELFGIDHVPQFEFTLPAADWADLKAHATDEQYVRAEAKFEGMPAGTIGLRFKGSYGTLPNCFDSTGKLTCAKLSFKVSFEEFAAPMREVFEHLDANHDGSLSKGELDKAKMNMRIERREVHTETSEKH